MCNMLLDLKIVMSEILYVMIKVDVWNKKNKKIEIFLE